MKSPNPESIHETQNPNPDSSIDEDQNLPQQSASPQTLNSQIPKQSPKEQAEEQEEEPEVTCMSSSVSPTVNEPITDTHVTIIISDQDPVLENPPSMMSSTRYLAPRRGSMKRKKPMPHRARQAFDKKLKTLAKTFKPIPFRPNKSLDFLAHEKLLKRLGLWDFVHVELERNIRTDIIAQLFVSYNPQKGCCSVNDSRIALRRSDLAKALKLHWKKDKNNVVEGEGGEEMVSQQSIAFIDDFVSNWVLLHDDTWILPPEVLNWIQPIKEGHPEKVDWASLMWFMVEKELAQGVLLGHCYYASHLQCLIKSQREAVFFKAPVVDYSMKEAEEDAVEVMGTEKGEDLKMSEVSFCVEMSEDGSYSKTGVNSVGNIMTKESDDVKIVEELDDVKTVEELDDVKLTQGDTDVKLTQGDTDVKLTQGDTDVKLTQGDTDVKLTQGDTDVKMTEDGTDVNMGKDGSNEKMENSGHDVKMGKGECDLKMGEDECDLKMGEDECDLKMGKDECDWKMGKDECDSKMGKDECDLKMGNDGCDLKIDNDSSYLKMGSGSSDVKMSNGGSYGGRRLEEPSIELSLGQDKSVKVHTVHDDAMDFEECKGQGLGQWLLNSEDNIGGHFLHPCKQDRVIVGEEEEKQEDQVHEREQQQEGEYTLLPRCNSIEANMSANFIEEIEASQVPYSSSMQLRDYPAMNQITSRAEAGPVSGGPSMFGNVLKTENDYEHGRPRTDVSWEQETMDVGLCMENAQHWIGKAKMAYAAKEHNFINSNANQELLINELKQRENVIEHLQKVMFEEQQRRHADIYRLERELFSMGNLLGEYKKALKENRRAFSEYRARFPLPDEQPLYKDVPGSGGLVLSVAELERRHQKQVEEERMNIEVTFKKFETYWTDQLEAHLNMADMLNSKLLDVEKEAKLIMEYSTEHKALFEQESTQNE